MATLYITEYANVPSGTRGDIQCAVEPAIANQTITITGTSAQSAAFNADTIFVRLNTDTTCFVLFGANPTATSSKTRLVADQTEYFGALGGLKVAVIS